MKPIERLAVAQALYKTCGELVDTKNPDSLRSQVDAEFLEQYENTGAKSFAVKIGNDEVGTYSLRFSKPTAERHEYYFNVYDYVLLNKWFADVTNEELREFIYENLREFAEWKWKKDGEVAYGCNIEEMVIPETPKEVQGGTLKVDPWKVAAALKTGLPVAFNNLLEGGENDEDN